MAVSKAQCHCKVVTLVLHNLTKQVGSLMLRMGQKIGTKFPQESVSSDAFFCAPESNIHLS